MKNSCKTPVKLVMFTMIVLAFFSCEDESSNEIPANEIEQQIEALEEQSLTEFPESKLISFDEIEKMTSTYIPGEMIFGNQKSTGLASEKQTGRMRSGEGANYYFYGTTLEGTLKGSNLNGELDVDVTFYGNVFRVFRGTYVSGNGETSEARGAVLADGAVYLILELPDNILVYGVGYENAENGGLIGRFSMFTTDGDESIGRWLANVKDIETPAETIVDIANSDGRFTTLINALNSTQLSDSLRGNGPFTVFAPTDAAFAALQTIPQGDELRDVLLYHVVNGKMDTRAIINNGVLETLFPGSTINIDFNGNGTLVIVNQTTQIILSNIEASNGYIHVIDAVLAP